MDPGNPSPTPLHEPPPEYGSAGLQAAEIAGPAVRSGACPTTCWTVLWEAKDSAEARKELLDEYYPFFLKWCSRQWPVNDEGQVVLHDWLESQFRGGAPFATVDRARGRFRDWCFEGLRHCRCGQLRKASAAKRGGLHGTVPLEEGLEHEVEADGWGADPRRDFDRYYAMHVMRGATARVLAGWPPDSAESSILRTALVPGEQAGEGIQAAFGISRADYYRKRNRLLGELREEVKRAVARGLDHPTRQDIEEEITHLFGSL